MSIDMRPTYYRKSGMPELLQQYPAFDLQPVVLGITQDIMSGRYQHKIITMSGIRRGKTASAAAIGCAWIEAQKEVVHKHTPVLFVPVRQLCYQNRTVDRGTRDEGITNLIKAAAFADILILDGVFSYLTQNDDLLLQAIYDSRQYCGKTTIVTTSIEDPRDCAGSILYRIERDSEVRVSF